MTGQFFPDEVTAEHEYSARFLISMENKPMRRYLFVFLCLCLSCDRDWNSPFEPENRIPSEGLVAYYPFNNSARDESSNAYHLGLIRAAYADDRFNRADSALLLNGIDAYAMNNNLLTIENQFTISLWIYPTTTHEIDKESISGVLGTGGQKYAIGPTHGNRWSESYVGLGVSAGTNGISLYEHGGNYMPAVLVWEGTLTRWTHVAVLYKDNRCTLYVDGKSKKIGLKSERDAQPSTRYIGAAYHGTTWGDAITSFFSGRVDDIRIYNRVLTAAEIGALYRESENSVFNEAH